MDKRGKASGELFLDDGDSLQTYQLGAFTHVKFHAVDGYKKKRTRKLGRFRASIVHYGYNVPQTISDIEILGLEDVDAISNVTYNDKEAQFSVDAKLQVQGGSQEHISPLNYAVSNTSVSKPLVSQVPVSR